MQLRLEHAVPSGGELFAPLQLELSPDAVWVLVAPQGYAAALLRACLAQQRLGGGRVLLFGIDPATLARRELERLRGRTGSVLQPLGLVSNLSLQANIELLLQHGTRAEARRRSDELLRLTGIEEWAEERPGDVPAGVATWTAFARAIAAKPGLLLLENPLPALDHEECSRLLALCREQCAATLLAVPWCDAALRQQVDGVTELSRAYSPLVLR